MEPLIELIGKRVITEFPGDPDIPIDMIPVDYVVQRTLRDPLRSDRKAGETM